VTATNADMPRSEEKMCENNFLPSVAGEQRSPQKILASWKIFFHKYNVGLKIHILRDYKGKIELLGTHACSVGKNAIFCTPAFLIHNTPALPFPIPILLPAFSKIQLGC